MTRRMAILLLALSFEIALLPFVGHTQYQRKTLIAHRGASAYAPEHTVDAYRLAMAQGADYVEQDLQITKDGVLVCLHDLTLERTTNVEDIYPDRFVTEGSQRHWYVADFTLAEIKRLDAGSWFSDKFKGAQVPTWQEAVDLVKGNAGLYPETKAPEVYGSRGFDMENLLVESLRKNNLDRPQSEEKAPLIIQSFSAASLKRLKSEFNVQVPLVLLVEEKDRDLLAPNRLQEIRKYATGIGPAKEIIDQNPPVVVYAHDAGLSVTPYTFRSASTGLFKRVRDEMEYFLAHLNVDAVFTDNPDQFPRN